MKRKNSQFQTKRNERKITKHYFFFNINSSLEVTFPNIKRENVVKGDHVIEGSFGASVVVTQEGKGRPSTLGDPHSNS